MKSFLCPFAFVVAGSTMFCSLRAADRPAPAVPPGFVPCKILSQARAFFPQRLLDGGVLFGEVYLVLEIGTDGRIADALLTTYTKRDFADESLRVARESRYAPSTIGGQPIISILNLRFVFEPGAMIVNQRIGLPADAGETSGDKYAYRPHGWLTLDRKPNRLHAAEPIYPQKWIEQGRTGNVVISFYIDETGRVRMPVARGESDEMLAAAAADAIKEWRFEPPLRRGKPVLAQAEQLFVFKPRPKGEPQTKN